MTDIPRKPWLAGLLSFFTIGLGHIYTGEARKGIFLFLGQGIFLIVFLPLFLFLNPVNVLAISIICGLIYYIICIVGSVKIAQDNSLSYQQKKYNKWYIYLFCWIAASIIIQPTIEILIKGNIMQAYKVPAGSMIPTLLPGDRILANKFIYKKNEPQRNDIIVFPFPKDPYKDYVKRIIGIEGDVIEIKDKRLFINSKEYYSDYHINVDENTITKGPRDNFGPITVPQGKYFVLGDNRDNSYDSRFWGFIPKKSIKGKIISIYWSWDNEISEVRWKRIGKLLK